jgi:hypothetical protein
MDTNQAKTDATLNEIKASQDDRIEKIQAWPTEKKAGQKAMEAYPEDTEANPEETKFFNSASESSKEEATAETFKALKKRHGDQLLAVRHCGQSKKQTQGNGGSWK